MAHHFTWGEPVCEKHTGHLFPPAPEGYGVLGCSVQAG